MHLVYLDPESLEKREGKETLEMLGQWGLQDRRGSQVRVRVSLDDLVHQVHMVHVVLLDNQDVLDRQGKMVDAEKLVRKVHLEHLVNAVPLEEE